jgi:hypothetical protein
MRIGRAAGTQCAGAFRSVGSCGVCGAEWFEAQLGFGARSTILPNIEDEFASARGEDSRNGPDHGELYGTRS